MAKAIVLREHGNSNVLKLEDIEIKKPKENELLIRQTAIGVHFHDIYVRSGLYKTLELPGIPGLEAVGIIEETGASIEDFKKGDKIAYITKNYGAYSSHRILDKNLAVKIPNFISDEMIATNFSRAITVQMLIEEVTKLNASDTILITAATGGVGRIFSQWAKSKGAVVIGTVGSKEKTIDSVGKDTFENSLKSIKVCGHLINFGQSSGPVDPISMSILAGKSLTISRPILFDYISDLALYQKMADSVFQAFKNNKITLPEFQPFKLKDANLAHNMLESRKGGGSVYLEP